MIMMEKKPIAALIAVIAVVTIVAAVAATMSQTSSSQTGWNVASFQVIDNKPVNQPPAPPRPEPEPSKVVISSFSVQQGTATECLAIWVLHNTGTQSAHVQPYVTANGVKTTGPCATIPGGETATVRGQCPCAARSGTPGVQTC